MPVSLTVSYDRAAQESGAIAQVIAALPVSLVRTEERGQLVGIDGAAGWPAATERAIDSSASGVLVVRPVPADVTSLIAKVRARKVAVVIDGMWTHNPAVANSVVPFGEVASGQCLLEARADVAVGSDWQRVLVDQLSLIRAAVSPVRSFEFIRRDESGYVAAALLAHGGRAAITAIRTNSVPQSATLRIVTPLRVVELVVPDPDTAIPGRVVATGPGGSNVLETVWETAHRAAWRRLHRLVLEGSGSLSDLEFFSHDQATAATR